MGSQQKESSWWEDSWICEKNIPSITRAVDPKKNTNSVIFALFNTFNQSFLVLYSFVQFLLPATFDTFKKTRNKNLPFFSTVQLSHTPNSHLLIPKIRNQELAVSAENRQLVVKISIPVK